MKNTSRILWGLSFVAVAIVLVLSQLGLITASISLGMALLGFIYLAIFVGGAANRSFFAMFLALGLAWLTYAPMFDMPKIGFWMMMIIVGLFSIGFHILFPRKSKMKKAINKNDDKWAAYEAEDQVGEHQKVEDASDNGYVRCANQFGALAKYVNTSDFKGAYLKNSFGELKVYFDQATLVTSPIEIEVHNSFGEMQLFIPKEWLVECNVSSFAGECKEHNSSAGTLNSPLVRLTGNVNFGEIAITYI